MKLQTYVHLEEAFTAHLVRAWRAQSAPIYHQIAELCDKGQFDAARTTAQDLSMASVGEENREYIKYALLSMAVFGAGMAGRGKPQFLNASDYDSLLNQTTSNILQYLANGATTQVQEQAGQLIARWENPTLKCEHEWIPNRLGGGGPDPYCKNCKVLKADAATASPADYVKPFVSFAGEGEDKLQLATSLNGSRIASWGFVAEADARQVDSYRLTAVLDGRTSPFCRMIDGTIFTVDDARGLLNDALGAQDPEDLATIQPWPSQDKASIAEYSAMTPDQLVAVGLQIPPFHPFCRTIMTVISYRPLEAGEGYEGENPAFPPMVATTNTFAELGNQTDQQVVDVWNQRVGLNPVDVGAALTSQSQAELLDGGGTAIDYEHGVFSQSADTEYGSTRVQQTVSIDTLNKDIGIDLLDFTGGTLEDQSTYMRNLLRSSMDLGQTVGADTLSLDVGEDALEYTKMGFLPAEAEWERLSEILIDELSVTGEAYEAYMSLTGDQQDQVNDIVGNITPEGLEVLANVPWEYEGKLFASLLFGKLSGLFSLSLNNPVAVAQAGAYLGDLD